MAISPDGTRVVVNRYVDQLGDIFVVDLASGVATQMSDFPANNSYPIWHYDSQSVVFSTNRSVGYEVYRKAPDQDSAYRIFSTPAWRHPMDWSRDGRFLVYRMNGPDLWVLNTATLEEIKVAPTSQQNVRLHWPQISSDGRWLAYQATDGTEPSPRRPPPQGEAREIRRAFILQPPRSARRAASFSSHVERAAVRSTKDKSAARAHSQRRTTDGNE